MGEIIVNVLQCLQSVSTSDVFSQHEMFIKSIHYWKQNSYDGAECELKEAVSASKYNGLPVK